MRLTRQALLQRLRSLKGTLTFAVGHIPLREAHTETVDEAIAYIRSHGRTDDDDE